MVRLVQKNIYCLSLLLLLVITMGAMPTNSEKTIVDFKLKNVDGKIVSLESYPNTKGFIIVFICNHCPFAKLYPERMNELNAKYQSLGVPLIAISSTDTSVYENDGYDKMIAKASSEHFNFPYLYDAEQTVAKSFKAMRTPHAFVIWKENGNWVVKYNGAIDDNGAEPQNVKHHYIVEAIDSLLLGKSVEITSTRSIGCQIHLRK